MYHQLHPCCESLRVSSLCAARYRRILLRCLSALILSSIAQSAITLSATGRDQVQAAWAAPKKTSAGKSAETRRRARPPKRKHSVKATFRCTLSLHDLRIRPDAVHPEQQITVKLFGPKKEYLYAWSVKSNKVQEAFQRSFSWSSCSRYQAMMLIIYAQDAEEGQRVISELPLRADLVSRMPERHETKEVRMRLSGGDVRLLSLKFEITAAVLKKRSK